MKKSCSADCERKLLATRCSAVNANGMILGMWSPCLSTRSLTRTDLGYTCGGPASLLKLNFRGNVHKCPQYMMEMILMKTTPSSSIFHSSSSFEISSVEIHDWAGWAGWAPSLESKSARAKCSQNDHGQVTSGAFRSDNSKQMVFQWRTKQK